MPEESFAQIRNIDREGLETWFYSEIIELIGDVTNIQEWSIASQLEMLDDGINLSLHMWSAGDDYILSRTACGYLLASCPEYYPSVASGRKYFNCSQIRKAKAILAQIEINTELQAI